MAENLPEPASRREEFLATAAGMTGIELPEPASREEQYLSAIAENGGGGGGGYVLPVASASTLGGVKVGENLSIDANGVLSAQGGGSAGGVTILTTDMYNYPADNPKGIALWLLDPGIYVFAQGDTTTKVYRASDWPETGINNGIATFLVCQKDRSNYKKVLMFNAYPNTDMSTGAQDAISILDLSVGSGTLRNGRHDVLTTDDVKDSLTSTATHIPLSANQGRVLNEKINTGAITTLTPFSNLNWPTSNPDGIAAWKQAGQFNLPYKTKLYLAPGRVVDDFVGRIEANQFENSDNLSVIAYRAVDLNSGGEWIGQIDSSNGEVFVYEISMEG